MNFKHINPKYALAVLSASLGSAFQHGYHYGVINTARTSIENWIRQNKKDRYKKAPSDKEIMLTLSVITSIFFLGGILGSAMTAIFSTKLGPKGGIIYNNFIMLIAAMFFIIAKAAELYEMFIVGRFLIGIHAGLNSGLCPVYLAEIAPITLRGSTTAMYSFAVMISFFLSQFFLWNEEFISGKRWYYLFGFVTVPGLVQMGVLMMCPESPSFLFLSLNDEARTRKAFQWLRNTEDIGHDMTRLNEYKNVLMKLPKISFKTLFSKALYRNPLFIALAMVVTQQCSAMEIVLNYSEMVLHHAGLTPFEVSVANKVMGTFLVVMTSICILLIDILGRRILFFLSLCGLLMDTIFLMIVLRLSHNDVVKTYTHEVTAVALVLIAAWYALGTGVIPIVVTVELFHYIARPFANSIVVPSGWFFAFLFSVAYIPLQERLGVYIFLINLFVDFSLLVFLHLFLPETKRKSSKEIINFFYTTDEDDISSVKTTSVRSWYSRSQRNSMK